MSNFDETTRSLSTIPPDFVPYMEKHRLYEFFYELVTQLLIQQPDDPIVFIKQSVQHIVRKRDIPRVILIAPPSFDKMTLAKILQKETGIRPVTLEDLYASSSIENMCRCYDANEIADRMKKLLMSEILHESGWILIDIPRNKKEARAMQYVGIIPTHVIQITSSVEDKTREKKDIRQCDYKRRLRGLRDAYANLLIEVETGTKTIQELGEDCATVMKIRKHYGAPSLFRIVLIGPRELDHRSLAKHVSESFNLVHVDFNDILKEVCLQETALGEMLRMCNHRCAQKVKSEARVQIIERYVLGSDCLKRGWILTSYPKTVEEFKLLDMISTPPNRVIILKIDAQTCRERLLNREWNFTTESEHELSSCESSMTDSDYKLDVHSNNYKDVIEQDEYKKNIDAILQYAGETASVINATGEKKCVEERLEACLMRPAPSAKPRIPYPPPTIDPMDIEFDPDDEPDLSVFDDIRAPEPKYSFI
ncbi:PREDICTED: adenylate kinase 8 isoform X1 [Trachymyrmex septentrionalis]|uniref:adenylate kinase 8 isoform X1 n=1 Tax=Trachymyrmex septentrionalis TaxID=34720 RepID=UPI00084F0AB9|nr:PREDICTED: adenylate kinase 8 isoform X1 [Trachymyrmex septentrionalis]